ADEYGDDLRKEAEASREIVRENLGDISLNSPVRRKEAIENHIGRAIENTHADQPLQAVAIEFPVLDVLLKYRDKSKLLSTSLDRLPNLIREETGRLHTVFNQNGAKTGRFSSGGGGVNLQNQPKEARKMFVAPEGYVLLGGDWSQQEYRCLAYYTQ